jgi:hypothetical protein
LRTLQQPVQNRVFQQAVKASQGMNGNCGNGGGDCGSPGRRGRAASVWVRLKCLDKNILTCRRGSSLKKVWEER